MEEYFFVKNLLYQSLAVVVLGPATAELGEREDVLGPGVRCLASRDRIVLQEAVVDRGKLLHAGDLGFAAGALTGEDQVVLVARALGADEHVVGPSLREGCHGETGLLSKKQFRLFWKVELLLS